MHDNNLLYTILRHGLTADNSNTTRNLAILPLQSSNVCHFGRKNNDIRNNQGNE